MTQTATRALPANLQGGLIVSCQALADEPLHSSFIMGRMALAAAQGGAAGIRANSAEDIRAIRAAYPEVLLMADCASLAEMQHADALGFDFIGTTLVGYTPATRGARIEHDDFALIRAALASVKRPIIAEGNINTPEKVRRVLALGVYSVVVGSAITRPKWITEQFVQATKP